MGWGVVNSLQPGDSLSCGGFWYDWVLRKKSLLSGVFHHACRLVAVALLFPGGNAVHLPRPFVRRTSNFVKLEKTGKICKFSPVFSVFPYFWNASKWPRGHEANASSGARSEAPRRSWEPGPQQHLGPENQDSQHMLNQPRGSFLDKNQKDKQTPQRRGLANGAATAGSACCSLKSLLPCRDVSEVVTSLSFEVEKRRTQHKFIAQRTLPSLAPCPWEYKHIWGPSDN